MNVLHIELDADDRGETGDAGVEWGAPLDDGSTGQQMAVWV